jgi:hypothetical protein
MRAMRITFIVVCVGIVFSTGTPSKVQAQAEDPIKLCRQITDGAERLKCYDRINPSAPGATGAQTGSQSGADAAWEISESKSPVDDSQLIAAALRSADGKGQLILRCRERKTDVALSITGFIKCGADARVIYRIDQEQPVDSPWDATPNCYLATARSPIPFIRALGDRGKLFVRMFDHHGAPYEALFDLGKVSEVRERLAQACKWEDAAPKR